MDDSISPSFVEQIQWSMEEQTLTVYNPKSNNLSQCICVKKHQVTTKKRLKKKQKSSALPAEFLPTTFTKIMDH